MKLEILYFIFLPASLPLFSMDLRDSLTQELTKHSFDLLRHSDPILHETSLDDLDASKKLATFRTDLENITALITKLMENYQEFKESENAHKAKLAQTDFTQNESLFMVILSELYETYLHEKITERAEYTKHPYYNYCIDMADIQYDKLPIQESNPESKFLLSRLKRTLNNFTCTLSKIKNETNPKLLNLLSS